MDPQIYNFGTHFRGTKMDKFSDLQNGIIVSGWGVPKVKQSRTRMQCSDPSWAESDQTMDRKMDPNLGIQNQ